MLALPACSRSHASSEAAVAAPAAGVDGGKPFGAFCVVDGECAGGACFHKRLKGPDAGPERRASDDPVEHDGYCSLRCNDDADCPVPPSSGRCGARGLCKRPSGG